MQPFFRALSSPNGHQRRCCNWRLWLTSCQVAATGTIAPGDPACSLREQLGENTQRTATYRHRDQHTYTHTHTHTHICSLTDKQLQGHTGTLRKKLGTTKSPYLQCEQLGENSGLVIGRFSHCFPHCLKKLEKIDNVLMWTRMLYFPSRKISIAKTE